jgi:hypothetical protein
VSGLSLNNNSAGDYTLTQPTLSANINAVPALTTNPTNQTACAGSPVTWSVAATGTGLTYQWQRNGTNLVEGVGNFTGTTSATLTNSAVSAADSLGVTNGYACVASLSTCTATSTTVSLTVNPQPSTSGLTGSSSISANQAGVSYSVTSTAGSTYAWTVPSDASITVGQGSASITVTFGIASGNVAVTETNGSGCVGSPVSLAVSVGPNHAPVATDASYTCAPGLDIKIGIASLIAAHVTDQDNDPITLQSVGRGTNGATIVAASGYISYTPADNNNPDFFTYTVSDGQGGMAMANIYIAVVKGVGQAKGIALTNGVATVDFAGIPGYTYDVQRSTDSMATWQIILTTNAPANGIWRVTDDFGGNPPASAYYRPVQH